MDAAAVEALMGGAHDTAWLVCITMVVLSLLKTLRTRMVTQAAKGEPEI